MNKAELISSVANISGETKATAERCVNAVIESIKGALKTGDEVRVVGFGSFVVQKRAASTGRNPRTGEAIQIPAAKLPKFKAGKELKDAVNK